METKTLAFYLDTLRNFCFQDRDMKKEFQKAQLEFFGPGFIEYDGEDEFKVSYTEMVNWFVFDRVMGSGRTPFAIFFEENQETWGEEEKKDFLGLKENVYGIFEVKHIEPGEGFVLEDIGTEKKYEIKDTTPLTQIMPGYVIVGRIFLLKGRYRLEGGMRCWGQGLDVLKKGVREIKKKGGETRIDALLMERVVREICAGDKQSGGK